MSAHRAPRVAIVGVRRVRQGLGQFFAKHLVAHGAVVPAFLASRPGSIDEGRATLRRVGVEARGYTDLDALLAADPVDALVIASPHETHLAWLEAAIGRGLHVLCEKPLVWDVDLPANEAMRFAELADARSLVLAENCPWPYVLATFDALHPQARRDGVRSFEMELAPLSSEPRAMLIDAVSHPLSVLQEFIPFAEARIRALEWRTVEAGRVELSFLFGVEGPREPIRCDVRLRTVREQPRPLALVLNGLRADRHVRIEDYALSLTADGRQVPLPDPMAALVGDFVRAVQHGEPAAIRGLRTWRIYDRLRLLDQIVRHFPGA